VSLLKFLAPPFNAKCKRINDGQGSVFVNQLHAEYSIIVQQQEVRGFTVCLASSEICKIKEAFETLKTSRGSELGLDLSTQARKFLKKSHAVVPLTGAT
jgi:hypothetical protein